jgi:hypothetical protein
MKSENQTRNLLETLHDINSKSFGEINDNNFPPKLNEQTYTSPITIDDEGKPMVYEGDDAYAVMGNVSMAIDTLEWVLEEIKAAKPVEDEIEATRYKDKIMCDGVGKRYIPDTSHETFIARLEGEW